MALLLAGPLAVRLGVSPLDGFRLSQLSALAGVAAIVAGVVALRRARRADPARESRAAVFGIALGVLPLALALPMAVRGSSLPILNDVTTNLEAPPVFGDGGEYPQEFAVLQRETYADLGPIKLRGLSGSEAFQLALRIADDLGWTVVSTDVVRLTFEATDESALFRFVDDVSVYTRTTPGAAMLEVRSRSRVGRSDLGANAARIRVFRDALRAAAG